MTTCSFYSLPEVFSVEGHQLVVKHTFLEFVDDGLNEMMVRKVRKVRTLPAKAYMGGLSDAETVSSDGDSELESGSDDEAKSASTEEPAGPVVTKVQQSAPATDKRTTIMLRNLPDNYTREMLLEVLDAEGFGGRYDFVYLPIFLKTQAGFGYAFVNAVDNVAAQELWTTFVGYNNWVLPTSKRCGVSWSKPVQGLRANVQRWISSSVMHSSVPDEYKPCIFVKGARAKFPRASRALQAPRF